MDVLKAELSRMRETFTANARLWSRVSDPLMVFGRDEVGYKGGQVNEGPGLEKAKGTLWSGVSQWSSGSAKEASGAGGQAEGEAGCRAKETEGVGKRNKVGRHSVLPKKNRKSFKGLKQEV